MQKNNYLDDTKQKIVFTAEQHIRRGSCCGNGCRHCPYEPKHTKRNRELQEKYKNAQ